MLSDDNDGGLEAEKLRKRLYFRERKRLLRIKQKSERRELEENIHELEVERNILMKKHGQNKETTILQWKDIAIALQEGRNEAILDHRKLNHLLYLSKSTLQTMKKWVDISWTPMANISNSNQETWRNTTLVAKGPSRDLGKEWIAAQMYHNTDNIFQKYQFPTIKTEFTDASFEFEENGFHFVRRWQTTMNYSMDLMMQVFREHFPSICLLDELRPVPSKTLQETTDRTRLHQLITQHKRKEWVNALSGEFMNDENTRSVFVARQIQDDEEYQMDHPQRNILFWLDLHRESNNSCNMRSLFILSHRLTKEGYVPFDEEALEGWGCNLQGCPEEFRQTKFKYHGSMHASALHNEVERRMQMHIQSILNKRQTE